MPSPAVILLSGGMDSAVCLAEAKAAGFACHAISFDYGQRHRFELEAARKVAASIGVAHHLVLKLDLRAIGGSALTAEIDVPKDRLSPSAPSPPSRPGLHAANPPRLADAPPAPLASPADIHISSLPDPARLSNATPHLEEATPDLDPLPPAEIPITYVPARNIIFLSLALAYAETIESMDLYIGVNAIDYSGYPDCRPQFIEAFERAANLATRLGAEGHEGRRFRIHTPLQEMSKADIVRRGRALGVDFTLTHSCYDPELRTGAPCGHCDACVLRARGFAEADAHT
jgi:7-cyano-7-deazaguanine synthase